MRWHSFGTHSVVQLFGSVPLAYKLGWVVLHAYFFRFVFAAIFRFFFVFGNSIDTEPLHIEVDAIQTNVSEKCNVHLHLAYFVFIRP